jgi:signal transduction histidine kinase
VEEQMFKLLPAIKIIIFTMVFVRVFRETPLSFPLAALALALVVSGFWRNFYGYEKPKVNFFTLHLDLLLAFVFSLLSQKGVDKFFIVYMMEGVAALPKPYWIAYVILTMAANAGSTALFDLRTMGRLESPAIAEVLLLGLIFVLVFSERRQREQSLAYEKQAKELGYVNLQLKESMAWSESLASEAERRRIAGEIHDSLGHNLTGLILTLEAGKRLMCRDVEAGKTCWDKALQVSRAAICSVRELVTVMKESNTEFELISRLRDMVQGVQDLTGLKIDIGVTSGNLGLSGKEQFNIYRIFQEALTNTLRHAHANHVHLSITGDKDLLYFSYLDNGTGTNQIIKGNGLNGIVERISDIGGTISFHSRSGSGFKIEGCIDRRGKE